MAEQHNLSFDGGHLKDDLYRLIDSSSEEEKSDSKLRSIKPFIPKRANSIERKSKSPFKFPDGGWVCSSCQNYNFYGRIKCNRCFKVKTEVDMNGKPKHLLLKKKPDIENINTQNRRTVP